MVFLTFCSSLKSGNYNSMFERICGIGPGSFRTQMIYECHMCKKRHKKGETSRKGQENSAFFLVVKALMLMAIFWTIALIWVVAGAISFGLLW